MNYRYSKKTISKANKTRQDLFLSFQSAVEYVDFVEVDYFDFELWLENNKLSSYFFDDGLLILNESLIRNRIENIY